MLMKFIIKLIPIKKLRHAARWYIETNFYNEYCYEEHIKCLALHKNKKNIKTIVLGSSHANYGFIPKDGEINLGGNSQDLYLSYKLYEYLYTHGFDNIKNIVLFFDVFSSGFNLSKTHIDFVCVPYKLLYGIPYREKLSWKARIIEKKCKKYLKNNTCHAPDGYRGMSLYKIWNKNVNVTERVKSHLKNNQRPTSQMEYLDKLMSAANRNHHNLYITTPPLRADYRAVLTKNGGGYNNIFTRLIRSAQAQNTALLLNYHDDSDFNDADFGDCDHLNQAGANKLANKIREVINDNKGI